MEIEIKAPLFPESITEGTLTAWHCQPGEFVQRDEPLVDVETDKVALAITAPTDGHILAISKQEGDAVLSEEVLCKFHTRSRIESDAAPQTTETAASERTQALAEQTPSTSPAARKLALEKNVDVATIQGTGKAGRITKEDVLDAADGAASPTPGAPGSKPPIKQPAADTTQPSAPTRAAPVVTATGARPERRVPMTRLRASIARRLVTAQQTAAMLTTFNEVDMSAVIELRNKYKQEFEQTHGGVRLGFMSFFVRASVEALKKFPMVNASLDDNDIVYHGYYDIGIAVGTPKGLVVPVLTNADTMGLAEIESQIKAYGEKAQVSKLTIEDMTGGTFTVSNGGIYGSLLSTPILNPPQTAILGMHKIEQRPVVIDNEIQIRPMMYLALSYDHRMIDGSEAVRFLVAIKNMLEQPARILLEL